MVAPTNPRVYSLVGLSHKTAPVEVRERLAVASGELPQLLSQLKAQDGVEEAMLVSTCNRVEAYVYGGAEGAESVKRCLAQRGGPGAENSLYTRSGGEALTHLFRVCCSLDSMILGEPQILGQVKDSFAGAQEAASIAGAMTQAAQAAFATAKRVRTETSIGSSPVSMASAAVELARKIFGGLDGRTVLLVGAGAMSELCAKHLSEGTSRILVVNRTLERAQNLALEVGGIAHPWEKLTDLLAEADIVVSSTAAQRPVLTVSMIHSVLKQRHYRPLFLVDLAVPRDIEPGVDKLENVYAYDVDDLQHVVDQGRSAREQEAKRAEAIVAEEVERFLRARQVRDAVPVLALLRNRAEEIARLEVEKTLSLFGEEELTPKQRKSIEAMGKAIVNKLLHFPTVKLRDAGKAGAEQAAQVAGVVAELFDLHESDKPNPPAAAKPNGAAKAGEPERRPAPEPAAAAAGRNELEPS